MVLQGTAAIRAQPLVRGQVMEATIKGAKVVVIGQSGGGTHACLQFAQHGIGNICGIDDDHVETEIDFQGSALASETSLKERKR